MKKSLKQSIAKIQQALLRLERSEGRTARKNARLKLTGAIRALKAQADKDFPAIAKPVNPKHRTLERRALRTATGLDRCVVEELAKRPWDLARMQAFINWIADACQQHCEPIELGAPGERTASRCNTWLTGTTGGVFFQLPPDQDSAHHQMHVLHKLAHLIQEHRRGNRDLAHSGKFRAVYIELLRLWQHGGALPKSIGEAISEEEQIKDQVEDTKNGSDNGSSDWEQNGWAPTNSTIWRQGPASIPTNVR